MAEEFRHNEQAHRFEVDVDGRLAGWTTYYLRDGVANFHHSYTNPEFRHRGLAGRLLQYAFDELRAGGEVRVRPTCPYVVDWMQRHPEYHDLLEDGSGLRRSA